MTIPWVALAFLLGNLLYLRASWRWVYYISIIYAVLTFTGTAIFYFPPPRPKSDTGKTRFQQFLQLDFVGIFLYTGGLTTILLGMSWGGNPGRPWNSASVIAPIVAGGIGLAASFAYDFYIVDATNRHVFFPKGLLSRFREFTVSLIVTFASATVYYTMATMLPQATQFIFTPKPLEIGVLLLPNGLGQFFGTAIVPILITKTGNPKLYLILALLSQTLFTGLYGYAVDGHRAAWSAFQFFGAGAFGLIVVATVLNCGLHVRPSELGIAVGLLGTFRSMGGSVGNAIFNSILRSVSNEQLPKRIIAAAQETGFAGDISALVPAVIQAGAGVPFALAKVEGVTSAVETATLAAFREAYIYAFRMVFYSTIPFGVIALIAALFVTDSTKYMTNHTHVRLVKDVVNQKRGDQSEARRSIRSKAMIRRELWPRISMSRKVGHSTKSHSKKEKRAK
jgi:hypothetical protein